MTTKDYGSNVTKNRKYFNKNLHLPLNPKWRGNSRCNTSASQDVLRGTEEGGCRSFAIYIFRDI